MKLNKTQLKELEKHQWTPVQAKNNQHGVWVSIAPADGIIFSEICDLFGLYGDGEDVKLFVVGVQEGLTEEEKEMREEGEENE